MSDLWPGSLHLAESFPTGVEISTEEFNAGDAVIDGE